MNFINNLSMRGKLITLVTPALLVILFFAAESVLLNYGDLSDMRQLSAMVELAKTGDPLTETLQKERGSVDSIRSLADSVQRVNQVIAELEHRSESHQLAHATCDRASALEQTFADILTDVSRISDMASQIATASEEQVAVTRELAGNMESVSEAAILTLTGSQEITQVTGEQARLARVLQDLANEFKVPAYS